MKKSKTNIHICFVRSWLHQGSLRRKSNCKRRLKDISKNVNCNEECRSENDANDKYVCGITDIINEDVEISSNGKDESELVISTGINWRNHIT